MVEIYSVSGDLLEEVEADIGKEAAKTIAKAEPSGIAYCCTGDGWYIVDEEDAVRLPSAPFIFDEEDEEDDEEDDPATRARAIRIVAVLILVLNFGFAGGLYRIYTAGSVDGMGFFVALVVTYIVATVLARVVGGVRMLVSGKLP